MSGTSPRYDHTNAYRNEALRAARDFHYKGEVIAALKAAKTEGEISRIMMNARREHFG